MEYLKHTSETARELLEKRINRTYNFTSRPDSDGLRPLASLVFRNLDRLARNGQPLPLPSATSQQPSMAPEAAASVESIIVIVGASLCSVLVVGALVGVVMMLVRGKR